MTGPSGRGREEGEPEHAPGRRQDCTVTNTLKKILLSPTTHTRTITTVAVRDCSTTARQRAPQHFYE